MPAHPLTRIQVKAVLKQTTNLRDQALLTLGFQTGFRIAELLSLTIQQVADLHGHIKPILTVSKSHMKGKRFSRTVKLNSDTQRVLKKWIKQLRLRGRARTNDALFQSRQGYKGKSLGARQVNNIIKELFSKAGCVGNFSSHSLRKTFIDTFLEGLQSILELVFEAIPVVDWWSHVWTTTLRVEFEVVPKGGVRC